MKFVRPDNAASIGRFLEDLRQTELTYSETGWTLTEKMPSGYRHDRYSIILGYGQPAFRVAVAGLKTWRAHHQRLIRVFPSGTEILPGETVIVTLGSSFFALAAPCQIVSVVDEPTTWGFAYGTLPGHPEQGEEAFVVSIDDDERVRFEIMAFSRPGDPIIRLISPISRWVQKAATRHYLRALRSFVEQNR